MAKKKQPKTSKKAIPKKNAQIDKTGKWLSIVIFIALAVLVFYPPFVMGLFINSDMFLYHIFTAIVLFLLIVSKIRNNDYYFFRTPIDWAFLIFVIAYLLSLFGAVHPGEAFYGFLRILNFFAIFLIISHVLKTYDHMETFLRILLAAGVGVAAIGILAALGYSQYQGAFDGRVILSTLKYPNTLAAYLSVLVIIGVTLWTREERLGLQFIYLLAGAVMSLVVLASLSKGAWLVYAVGALLLVAGMSGIFKFKAIYGLLLSFLAGLVSYIKFYPAVIEGKDGAGGYLLPGFLLVALGIALWRFLVYLYNNRGTKVTASAVLITLVILMLPLGIIGRDSLGKQTLTQELSELLDFQGSSFVSRIDFNRWGWEIVKDYPVNGTGAGGWDALYHQYQDYLVWTAEAHNHFLQVWIESGTVGFISFIAILAAFFYCLNKMRNHIEKEDWILAWGVTTAMLGFIAHSIIDFDMSFGAMAILFWSFIAIINAMYFNRVSNKKTEMTPAKKIGNVSAAVAIVLTLGIAGSCFWSAHLYARQGAAALVEASQTDAGLKQAKLWQEAEHSLKKAVSLDPFSSEYITEVAFIDAMMFNNLYQERNPNAPALYQKAKTEIDTGARLKPNNLQIRRRLTESAVLLGDPELMIEMAEGAILANPNNIEPYTVLANYLWDSLQYANDNNDKVHVNEYAEKLYLLDQRLQKQQKKIRPDRPWNGSPLVWTPEMQENIHEVNIMLGKSQ